MTSEKNKIMDAPTIAKTIKRIAYQIYEHHYEEKQLVLAGISKNGVILAQRICKEIETISDIEVIFIEILINKKSPREAVVLSQELSLCEHRPVVVVDDVLNTGSTLMYAVTHFLSLSLKMLQTAVLVNRNHKKFPIKGDFKGISLSTAVKEHISVEFGENEGVYLS